MIGLAAPACAQDAALPQVGPHAAPTHKVEVSALPVMDTTPAFDAAKATQAYLAKVSGPARAKSDAYFEGGYGLQLLDWLYALGVAACLHLKSGISYLGDGRLAVDQRVAHLPAFARFERVLVEPAEAYAANCVRVNDRVLVPEGYPRFSETLERLGYRPLLLDVSEYRKMDGGLSCLSIRF